MVYIFEVKLKTELEEWQVTGETWNKGKMKKEGDKNKKEKKNRYTVL